MMSTHVRSSSTILPPIFMESAFDDHPKCYKSGDEMIPKNISILVIICFTQIPMGCDIYLLCLILGMIFYIYLDVISCIEEIMIYC